MSSGIAIVGMGCRYPGATSPQELWDNVLARRRYFRLIPDERLPLSEYGAADREAADHTYVRRAALLEGWEFDRIGYRVAGSTYRSTDPVHWLALEVAAAALADAGFPEGEGLPRDTTGVVVGNTLTGEVSRAHLLRLRWPYVRRVVAAELAAEEEWTPQRLGAFLDRLEASYKAPFAEMGEESLAGGLANVIAGRICNYFDFKGGGYSVDGACASSLLAVITACSALEAGDADVIAAGGVDISLDPFELVGFARTGALAPEEMRVYDRRSQGFWPGEGCGFVVLMREEDARADGRRVYASITGWGVSSDGKGGITRPEAEGQMLALERAYGRSGFGIDTVAYFEGHGTGTVVGDATEIRALSAARRKMDAQAAPAALGSIKANIGHTKAAAGLAGLIKATMAVDAEILPPTTTAEEPHEELGGAEPTLRVLSAAEAWPAAAPLRAGVSAFGFGGINTHMVVDGGPVSHRGELPARERAIVAGFQDAELFLLAASDAGALRDRIAVLAAYAGRLAAAELTDLAAHLAAEDLESNARGAIVAGSPEELADRLAALDRHLEAGTTSLVDERFGVFLGLGRSSPRIGFLFPGHGAPVYGDGGAWIRRFPDTRRCLTLQTAGGAGEPVSASAEVQHAIVGLSMAGLCALSRCGVEADVAVGHSLGEITALHWGGVFDVEQTRHLLEARSSALGAIEPGLGAMAGLQADVAAAKRLAEANEVVVAAVNSSSQTVIAGPREEVEAVVARAAAAGVRARLLPVGHAFHSPLMTPAQESLGRYLATASVSPLRKAVFSTVTGGLLGPGDDPARLLVEQMTTPVRFSEAATRAATDADLLIEVGPGRILSGLVRDLVDQPVVATDAGGPSLRGLLAACGAAFAVGAKIDTRALFADRLVRPFDPARNLSFLPNPCETAPPPRVAVAAPAPPQAPAEPAPAIAVDVTSTVQLARELAAAKAELPLEQVRDDHRLLSDLHLNSITVGQIVVEAARLLGVDPPVSPAEFADARVADLAEVLEELQRHEGTARAKAETPAGVDSWLRAFTVDDLPRGLPPFSPADPTGSWDVIAPDDHPWAGQLGETLARTGKDGVAVCLPPHPEVRHLTLLLQGAAAVVGEESAATFLLVQHGGGGASFARSLHLEKPTLTTCVVDLPPNRPGAVATVAAEVQHASGFVEARYDDAGIRTKPVLRPISAPAHNDGPPLEAGEVLLVTGGGRGIAAECAIGLARSTGARLALVGRSRPEDQADLAQNLERFAALGVEFTYVPADVTDPGAVRAAVREIEATLGPIRGVLHGSGRNEPRRIAELDLAEIRATLAPKTDGLRNVLDAVDTDRLKLLVAFGSIIARIGLKGEAHYGLANEWLARLVESFAADHPQCRCRCLEWSVWSGTGMGERLGVLESLAAEGITPITPDDGTAAVEAVLAQDLPPALVVTSRFGDPPTLRMETPELPLTRFVDSPRVYYPGIELVVDVELSADSDWYLPDHVLGGEQLFPAALGLEAMAQVAAALVPERTPLVATGVRFERPVVVPDGGSTTIRLAALAREPHRVEVALRCDATAFQANHFGATFSFAPPHSGGGGEVDVTGDVITLDPRRDLYGSILFQRGRFRRVAGYQHLSARHCLARIHPSGTEPWFGRFLPQTLVWGDPGAHDAAMHAIQACIPHATLLPVAIEEIVRRDPEAEPRYVEAVETGAEDGVFTYDVTMADEAGSVVETWRGLRLRAVEFGEGVPELALPLLGPYAWRRLDDLIPGAITGIAAGSGDRAARRVRAIAAAAGGDVAVRRRPDGKPEIPGGPDVSLAHLGGSTLAVAASTPVGCDFEAVASRSDDQWSDLLGSARIELAELIAEECGEPRDVATTRLWGAAESLRKLGARGDGPLLFDGATPDGWVLLRSGAETVATGLVTVGQTPHVLAVAVRTPPLPAGRAPGGPAASQAPQPPPVAAGRHGSTA